MKNKKKLIVIALLSLFLLVGCRQATRASYNVSRAADEFNVTRRVAVLNMRSDEVVFEVVGRISIDTEDPERLVMVVEAEEGVYKKHFINMTEWNMYVVEDLYGAEVSTYHYEVNYTPEMIAPIDVITED